MPTLIEKPQIITAAGNKPKRIEEYAGRVSSGHENVSVARMVSPGGWEEPAQDQGRRHRPRIGRLAGPGRVASVDAKSLKFSGSGGLNEQRQSCIHGYT